MRVVLRYPERSTDSLKARINFNRSKARHTSKQAYESREYYPEEFLAKVCGKQLDLFNELERTFATILFRETRRKKILGSFSRFRGLKSVYGKVK